MAEAKKHFEAAMATYEKHLNETPIDYETVALNYVGFLKATGNEKGAVQVAKRSAKKPRHNFLLLIFSRWRN